MEIPGDRNDFRVAGQMDGNVWIAGGRRLAASTKMAAAHRQQDNQQQIDTPTWIQLWKATSPDGL